MKGKGKGKGSINQMDEAVEDEQEMGVFDLCTLGEPDTDSDEGVESEVPGRSGSEVSIHDMLNDVIKRNSTTGQDRESENGIEKVDRFERQSRMIDDMLKRIGGGAGIEKHRKIRRDMKEVATQTDITGQAGTGQVNLEHMHPPETSMKEEARPGKMIDLSAMDDDYDEPPPGLEEFMEMIGINALDESDLNHMTETCGEKIKITVDSGAAISAMPVGLLPNVPIDQPPENKHYRAANGTKIKDQGGKRIVFKTDEGGLNSMQFRLADVTKTLASVSRMCKKGNRVIFDDDGSFIENKESGKRLAMKEENGVYVIDVMVKNLVNKKQQVFARQGM